MVPPSSSIPISRGYVAPQVSGGHLVHKMGNFGNIVHPSQGITYIHVLLHPYMDHMGGGYYPTGQGHGPSENIPYQIQYFQGTWNQML